MPLSLPVDADVGPDKGIRAFSHIGHNSSAHTLRIMGAHDDFDANYEISMKDFVASEWPDNNQKSKRAATRLLIQPISRHLLSLIWKESTFVTEEELRRESMKRAFPRSSDLNCHNLAVRLSDEPCDVASNTTHFRRIIECAFRLDLVSKTPCGTKKIQLSGTATLDAFMRDLIERNARSLQGLIRSEPVHD